jgi:hypothetical protein
MNENLKPYLEKPEKVFFYARPDGSTFACKAEDAYNVKKTGKFKQLGVSDGKLFYEAVKQAQEVAKTDLEKAQEILRQGEKDELELAKGHMEEPPNFDHIDARGRPTSWS